MTWRTRISIIGAVVLVIMLAVLLSGQGASAAPLRQIPPTNTPAPPTNTPAPPTNTPPPPTNTPIPSATPQASSTPSQSTPAAETPTIAPPSQEPHSGGGGGAPPGPSGTPVVNGCVRSIGRNGISLGAAPGFYQPHVQIVPRNQLALVLAGPERVDNIWWWRLRAESGAEGWGNQDEMTPDPGPCAVGGSVSPETQAPPYPVTILPAATLAQVPAAGQMPATAMPLAQPTVQAMPAQQDTLPQTGNGLELWFLAGLLAITVVVVGFMRRRWQAQPVAPSAPPDEDTEPKE